MSSAESIAEAYVRCEAITREQAANFFYGIRLLPSEQRSAMCAVYAFARRIDDIGDGTLRATEKLAGLQEQSRALEVLERQDPSSAGGEDPVMVALADARQRFELPVDALGELIEGVRMDVLGIDYESFEELVIYCRRVAGTIGRLCLAIFGLREDADVEPARARALADDLGVALQLTNILRDMREDARNGRVYLPQEDLRRFGLLTGGASTTTSADTDTGADPGTRAPHDEGGRSSQPAAELLASLERSGTAAEAAEGVRALVSFEAARAEEWFERGMELATLLDRRSAACVLAMAGIYRRLLTRIEANPEQAAATRMSLSKSEKAWVAMRGMLGVGA